MYKLKKKKKKSQGMDYLDDIPKFVRLMFNASKTKHVKKLLRRIEVINFT